MDVDDVFAASRLASGHFAQRSVALEGHPEGLASAL
jgi:hypothetical protein